MGKLFRGINIKQMTGGFVAGIIIIGLIGVFYKVGFDQGGKEEVLGEKEIFTEEIEGREIYITVETNCSDYGFVEDGRKVKRYCIDYIDGESAFDVMRRLDDKNEYFSFSYDEADFGVFITSINNFHPDIGNSFWAFLVNGEMSMFGVSDYIVDNDDELGFRVEEIKL